MIPMQITPQEYIKYHKPAPAYLFAVRRLDNYEQIGSIAVPTNIRQESRKFVKTAEILCVSPFSSEDPEIEAIKVILSGIRHVGFEFHAVASVTLMPQFTFPEGDDVIMLHVKDVTVYGLELEDLLQRQRDWEKKEMKRLQKEADEAAREYELAKKESKAWKEGKNG